MTVLSALLYDAFDGPLVEIVFGRCCFEWVSKVSK